MNARTALVLVSALLLGPARAHAQLPPGPPGCAPVGLPVPLGGLPDPGLTPHCEISVDFLHWWMQGTPFPSLFTISDVADRGILGAPTTRLVLDTQDAERPILYGARLGAQFRLDDLWGVHTGGFFLTRHSRFRTFAPPLLAVPIIDALTGENDSVLLVSPNTQTGNANLETTAQLWSLEANSFLDLFSGTNVLVQGLAGLRYAQLTERFRLRTTTLFVGESVFFGLTEPAGSSYLGVDDFTTTNHFYGGQLGIRSLWRRDGLVLGVDFLLAVGPTRQQLEISGSTTLFTADKNTAIRPGNIFTQTSNIGRYSRDTFALMPMCKLAFGYQFNPHVRLLLGYDVFYWTEVVRPVPQIDTVINPNLVPIQDAGPREGPQRPEPRFLTGSFWAQGVSVAVDLSF